MICAVDDCDREGRKRGLCVPHYRRAYSMGTHTQYPATEHPERDGWVNPLVCVCQTPETDALGECSTCRRKPAELLRRPA